MVDDNPGDARLMLEALRDLGLDLGFRWVECGEEALRQLRQLPGGTQARPDLIILDLNMPRKDGREVLEEIKTCAQTRAIPTVILTTSEAESDIHRAYHCHANCFLKKPVTLEEFILLVRELTAFWFGVARRPSAAPSP
jgi:CheY-like chemotaxis protein